MEVEIDDIVDVDPGRGGGRGGLVHDYVPEAAEQLEDGEEELGAVGVGMGFL